MTVNEQLSEYDFSDVEPSKEEFQTFLSDLTNNTAVVETNLYLIESEVHIVLSVTDQSELEFLNDLPIGVQIRDATVRKHGNPVEIEVNITFYDWFGIEEQVSTGEKETVLETEECTAFIFAHLEQLPEVASATPIQDEDSYKIQVTFSNPVMTTRLFEEFVEMFGVRFTSLTISEEGISEVELYIPNLSEELKMSAYDAFRMTQLKHHERLALESYSTELPCGHIGAIRSELIAKPSSADFLEDVEEVLIDGFACAKIQLQDKSSAIPRINIESFEDEYDDQAFVPIETLFGFFCTECQQLYHFNNIEHVKRTLLESPRPKRVPVEMPTGNTYQFAVFPLTPKPLDLLPSSDIVAIFNTESSHR